MGSLGIYQEMKGLIEKFIEENREAGGYSGVYREFRDV